MTEDEREELEALRQLRAAVDAVTRKSVHLFRANQPTPTGYRCERIEVPVPEWDEMMDAIGDLERIDADRNPEPAPASSPVFVTFPFEGIPE